MKLNLTVSPFVALASRSFLTIINNQILNTTVDAHLNIDTLECINIHLLIINPLSTKLRVQVFLFGQC